MRTIKFRAWDKKKRLMIYDIQNAYDMYKLNEDENNQKNYEQSDIYYDEAFRWILENNDVIIEQFTGLTDKNGKDIYEGDRVFSGRSQNKGIVFWHYQRAMFCVDSSDTDIYIIPEVYWIDYDVIGNIHEEKKI